ncbi:MAG: hypothetical protein DRJ60_00065 [Thermoprotei archaeon]|nr:MAG: hypothetical protein DRJ60_00065 [Thermoprotei archaeon]
MVEDGKLKSFALNILTAVIGTICFGVASIISYLNGESAALPFAFITIVSATSLAILVKDYFEARSKFKN